MRAFLKKLLIILFWLAVWQLLSLAVHNVILLSGPFETLKALWALIPTKDFWISVATSLARILAGFLAQITGKIPKGLCDLLTFIPRCFIKLHVGGECAFIQQFPDTLCGFLPGHDMCGGQIPG